ncbi:MAG: hypothetical protein LBE59_00005 [Nevskiaceae bacterium]|jgi:folate-binding protein YgfZ|nr:hypothetical protein [Nevskiaceae bacterium]
MPMPEATLLALPHLNALWIRGPDARAFLQGQLSQDMGRVTPATPRLAGLHDPQGRCLAVMRVFAVDGEQYVAVLPEELLEVVAARLRRVVLRARVAMESGVGGWRVYGLCGARADVAAAVTAAVAATDAAVTGPVHMGDADGEPSRALIVAPRNATLLPKDNVGDESRWHALDIRDGLPQVFAATSGAFTAQMLNLDVVDGVSFTKGCYTGQEIIARSHYLGQVKRRMRRFQTSSQTALLPGASVRLADGRTARIVNAAPDESGGQQFLAVTQNLGAQGGGNTDVRADDDARTALPATELPLPYTLPA